MKRLVLGLVLGFASSASAQDFVVDTNIRVPTPDGAVVCAARIVHPKGATGPLPTLLQFSIYDPFMSEARRTAAHGYVAVEGEPRGKGCGSGTLAPYENDGRDAETLINWIAKQPWSDGRVGLYGGSYNGGAAWAAAKRMPKPLKAIMVGAPVAPGLDVPMEGNVFWMFVYPWTFYVLDNPQHVDTATYNDRARWQRLDHDWYTSGRAFRDHDTIDGTPNPYYDRWLEHPSYDAYWQAMIPYRDDFARITIPVLQTAGYYYGGPGAALYYFSQHHQYNPNAEHYLVIGPYGHFDAQSGPSSRDLNGYHLDSVAMVDLHELRYQFFDYVFKGAPKPAMLGGAVNYQVMGANVWKHAPSIAAMAERRQRIPLGAATLTVDLADRSDVDRVSPGGGIVDTVIDTWNGVKFSSDPFPDGVEVSGLFSGSLDVTVNKKDFDFEVQLYELTRDGHYLQLSQFWSRASYLGHQSERRLLIPGQRQRLNFTSIRLMSRQFAPGSRLVTVITVIKEPGRQINYGTGKDVSDETVADAKGPLRVQFSGDSFIDLPVSRVH